MVYDLKQKGLIKEILNRKPKRVLLQFPEGLKKKAFEIANEIESKTNSLVIISGNPCYGGCDVALEEAKKFDIDLIVHYGHAPFMKIDFPIIYIEARYEENIRKLVEKSLEYLRNYKKMGLCSTIQHIHQLDDVKEILEKNNKEVFLSKKKGHCAFDGQVLGCEYNLESNVDANLIIGNKFHALGLSLSKNKPVILIDPFTFKVEDITQLKNKTIKQRVILIEIANCKFFCPIFSLIRIPKLFDDFAFSIKITLCFIVLFFN
jgi:2-(3-amino-3-carboxypropyl)histidine synthase